MRTHLLLFWIIALTCHSSLAKTEQTAQVGLAELGAILFNDTTLSQPKGQACSTCHNPAKHFADPGTAVREGAVKGAVGFRNTPSLKYAAAAPEFSGGDYDEWVGGLFWDGRSNSLEEQALEPFFNPVEMNNTEAGLAKALRQPHYKPLFESLFGSKVLKDDTALVRAAAQALADFQRTPLFAPFDSKYDYVQAGLMTFTPSEERGKRLFNGGGPGFGNCLDCHSGSFQGKDIFTRFVHHNILVPRNTELAFYKQPETVNPQGKAFIDIGTAMNKGVINSPIEGETTRAKGLFRTPSLRNIEKTAPYMHNGVFKTLEEVLNFYIDIHKFGPPEVRENKSAMLSTILEITQQDKKDIIAFLKTLTDGYPASAEIKNKLREKQKAVH